MSVLKALDSKVNLIPIISKERLHSFYFCSYLKENVLKIKKRFNFYEKNLMKGGLVYLC